MDNSRQCKVERNTKETTILMDFNIDGKGVGKIDSGIGFFDHMLEGFTKHGFFDLDLKVTGDDTIICVAKDVDGALAAMEKIRSMI